MFENDKKCANNKIKSEMSKKQNKTKKKKNK